MQYIAKLLLLAVLIGGTYLLGFGYIIGFFIGMIVMGFVWDKHSEKIQVLTEGVLQGMKKR